jgi:phosphohistidine phosphatase
LKTLYLIRHAKSSWKDTSLDDFDRPLNKRGQHNAPFMAQLLQQLHVVPDLILSSPAVRAKTTAQTFAHILKYTKEIEFHKALYLTSVNTFLSILRAIGNEHQTVLIFGHNPELTLLANTIGNCTIENIPTCGVVQLKLKVNSWNALSKNNANLVTFEFPKKHQIQHKQ